MERALDIELLTDAIGSHDRLPTPAEIQELLLRSELALFTGEQEFDEGLLRAAWYLHAVATTPAVADDQNPRRGDAGRVSAHIFDVYLQQRGDALDEAVYRRHAVAAQAGYLIGDIVPNAVAVGGRRQLEEPDPITDPGLSSLHAAGLMLALDLRSLGPFLMRSLTALGPDDRDLNVAATGQSSAGAVFETLQGIALLRDYFLEGDNDTLRSAHDLFIAAINNPFSLEDTDSRWVAALMADFGTACGESSLWSLLPPDHPEVQLAFTRGDPPVALLWPPQAELLRARPGPFDPETRRIVLSFPTSAGKTLLAQILICRHVASAAGRVCVVAPTHSLCREIKASLDQRLQFLGTWAFDASTTSDPSGGTSGAAVTIMTPERLSSLLRSDPESALERFTMFIFDEAHLLQEPRRGWRLEETMTLLHYLTLQSEHRIVVMSAALGDATHVTQWLSTDSAPLSHSSTWRGPRRLQVVFSPEVDWDDVTEIEAKGNRQPRRQYPQDGAFFLRPRGSEYLKGSFGPTGQLVRRWSPAKNKWILDSTSTSQIEQLLPMVRHLLEGPGQPCLVVVASRRDAKSLATLIAAEMPQLPSNAGLVDLLRTRLPAGHTLPDLAGRGVAYHHAVLPREVQAELEEATRKRLIRCLVATTTLTEGVNLPFKSVVIGKTGWGSGENREEIIDPSRLLNAFGRAGRACRETEGWLFYAWFDRDPVEQLDRFDATAASLELRSSLLGESALESLETFEALYAEGVDAVLSDSGHAANGFCSYVWFVADLLSQLQSTSPLDQRVGDVLESTLAWQQFGASQRQRWESVAKTSLEGYLRSSPERRARWSRAGTSLSSTALLEDISDEIQRRVLLEGPPQSAAGWLDLLFKDGIIERLIALPENEQFRGIRPRFNASLDSAIDVDYLEMIQRWVSGQELDVIANEMLSAITDDDYRADVVTEYVSAVFEHHLPWVLRILIGWSNTALPDEFQLPPALSLHLQHGVGTPSSLELMTNGVRSRRLATRVAQVLGEDEPRSMNERLRNMTIDLWRDTFDAAPTELRDLLSYVHDPTLKPASSLLGGDPIDLDLEISAGVVLEDAVDVSVRQEQDGPEPRAWMVESATGSLGQAAASAHMSLETLTSLGIPLTVVASVFDGMPKLTVTMSVT